MRKADALIADYIKELEDYFEEKKVKFLKYPEDGESNYTSINAFYKFVC